MKYFILAGEASGDLHGSNLIEQIKLQDTNATIQCWGGELMKAKGAIVLKDINQLAFMGFVEVAKNIISIMANFADCKKQITAFAPDVIVLIDYPGFNIRMAKWAHPLGYKIAYYISPQIWAWKENRVHTLKKYVHQMICILPFEQHFYKKYNMNVHYVGHPLLQVVNNFVDNHPKQIPDKPIIALLPGSRLQEIQKKLPIFLSVVSHFPAYNFVVAQSPTLSKEVYLPFLEGLQNVQLIQHQTYNILNNAHAAIVTSGTATLETALFGVPQIVCYKGNSFSYQIAKALIKVPFISLVNLIAEKKIVTELIQQDVNTKNLMIELQALLEPSNRKIMIEEYNKLSTILGTQHASQQTATIILQLAIG
jgi:lipid-A-disaccharide synthase